MYIGGSSRVGGQQSPQKPSNGGWGKRLSNQPPNTSPTNIAPAAAFNGAANDSIMWLKKELATLKVAHSELQCQHSTLTSSYGSLKDAHEKQTQLLKETTTRANTADAALHAQREGHAAELRAIQLQIRTERDAAALAVEAATERCATLEKEIKTTRLAWAESQETLQKVCAQRQDSFSSRMNEVSRLSRVGAAPPIITTSTSPPTEVALTRHASSR